MSDIIESYLKKFLREQEQIEIKRSDIAEKFDCVPSQVNYVINTRFTQAHGYLVESKRGGGGYIRIVKIQLVDEVDYLDQMIQLIDDDISEKKARQIISTLLRDEIITQREARIMNQLVSEDTLASINNQTSQTRAFLLKKILKTLRID